MCFSFTLLYSFCPYISMYAARLTRWLDVYEQLSAITLPYKKTNLFASTYTFVHFYLPYLAININVCDYFRICIITHCVKPSREGISHQVIQFLTIQDCHFMHFVGTVTMFCPFGSTSNQIKCDDSIFYLPKIQGVS